MLVRPPCLTDIVLCLTRSLHSCMFASAACSQCRIVLEMPMQLPAAASSELCASVLVGSILSVPSDEAKADAEWMQASIRHQINQRNFSKAEAQQFWKHMHFATASVAEVGHWIPGLLRQWTSPRKIVSVTSQQGTAEMPVQNCPVSKVQQRCLFKSALCSKVQQRYLCKLALYSFHASTQGLPCCRAIYC